MENHGATVVITHHIRTGKQPDYEAWLDEIGPYCRKSPGFIDWQLIRPITNLTYVYTVIIRFDTTVNLRNWMESEHRKVLVEKATPLLAKDDKFYIKSGLDFLFLSESEKPAVPVRWKQYLVTWSAIYPLSLLMPLIIGPLLRKLELPQSRFIDAFFISGSIVFIMVYALMPAYTKLIRKWLFK